MSYLRKQRDSEIRKMVGKGYTYREIGERFNISRQRVFQIINKILKPLQPKEPRDIKPPRVGAYSDKELYMKQGRGRTRMAVRLRDEFTCQDCGDVRTPEKAKELGKRLFDVHHTKGMCGKLSRSYDKIGDLSGMVTLCHQCHFNRPEHRTKKLFTPNA